MQRYKVLCVRVAQFGYDISEVGMKFHLIRRLNLASDCESKILLSLLFYIYIYYFYLSFFYTNLCAF